MAKIDAALTSSAYSKFTSGLDIANTADAIENDIINFKIEKNNREVKTLHTNMKNISENTKSLQF